MNESVLAPVQAPDERESFERFQRLFCSFEHELTPDDIRQVGYEVALGNYAREVLATEGDTRQGDFLKETIAKGEQAQEMLVDVASNQLGSVIKSTYDGVGGDRKRPASLLTTAVYSKQLLRNTVAELDYGSSDPVRTVLDMVRVELDAWLRRDNDYVVRPRRAKAHILPVEEQREKIAALQTGDQSAVAPLMESYARLAKFIAVEEFVKPGKLPGVVDADDLAQEALFYAVKRAKSYDPEKGHMPNTHVFGYVRPHMQKWAAEMAGVIQQPVYAHARLFTRDEARRRGIERLIKSGDNKYINAAYNSLDSHIYRLEAGDDDAWLEGESSAKPLDYSDTTKRGHHTEIARSLRDTDSFVTDPEGPVEYEIGWRELLTNARNRYMETPSSPKGRSYTGPDLDTSDVFDQFLADNLGSMVDNYLADTLRPREHLLIELRFGLAGETPRTLEEVGQVLGVCKERVRQIEANALSKLRHPYSFGGQAWRGLILNELPENEIRERENAERTYRYIYGPAAFSPRHTKYEPVMPKDTAQEDKAESAVDDDARMVPPDVDDWVPSHQTTPSANGSIYR